MMKITVALELRRRQLNNNNIIRKTAV